MTETNTPETEEVQDESNDNELIRSLRAQLKEKEKELKNRPDPESMEAEIRSRLERDNAITAELGRLGHPAGILDSVKAKLEEDAEINRETVAQALQGVGYQVEVGDEAEQSEGDEPSSQESDLARVNNLSTQVRSAAVGGADPAEALSKKINAATSQEELAQVMAEAELTTQLT